jgi:hypothetical protein
MESKVDGLQFICWKYGTLYISDLGFADDLRKIQGRDGTSSAVISISEASSM